MNKNLLVFVLFVAAAYIRVASSQSSVSPSSLEPSSSLGPSSSMVHSSSEPTTPPTTPKITSEVTGTTTKVMTTSAGCPQCMSEPHFDIGSFFGGMLLGAGLIIIGYLAYYFIYGRKHSHTGEYSHFG